MEKKYEGLSKNAEVIPTGRWHQGIGRVRPDMHLTGNKRSMKGWGVSATVRLMRA